MSYEGYEQWLCRNGHLHTFDCYMKPDEKHWRCPHCKEPVAWRNSVDETNGESAGYVNLRQNTPADICEHCGKGVIEPPTYFIPDFGRTEKRGRGDQSSEAPITDGDAPDTAPAAIETQPLTPSPQQLDRGER